MHHPARAKRNPGVGRMCPTASLIPAKPLPHGADAALLSICSPWRPLHPATPQPHPAPFPAPPPAMLSNLRISPRYDGNWRISPPPDASMV